MNIRLRDQLPFVDVTIIYRGQTLELGHVLLDTGSAGSVFSADKLLEIGLTFAPDDKIYSIRGVGGREAVFAKRIDRLMLGPLSLDAFEIEVGAVDYGFEIEGILGMDFLVGVGAIVDPSQLQISNAK